MVGFIIFLVVTAGMWKMFEKAGIEGWKAAIPFYNIWVLITKIAEKPWWYFLLLFVPIVNIVIVIIINIEVAKAFGKPKLFAIGLIFVAFIFYPLLGFGDAVFRKTSQEKGDFKAHDETLHVTEKKENEEE